jgi:hypothetical protein
MEPGYQRDMVRQWASGPCCRDVYLKRQPRVNAECNCRSWSECAGGTGPDFTGPCPGPPKLKTVVVTG